MTNGAARTAAAALIAAMPGLMLTAAADFGSNALTIRADFLLSLLDAMALAAVWCVSRSGGGAHAERMVGGLVALCMAGSLVLICWLAIARLAGSHVPVEGPGLALAMALNGTYAIFNGWLFCRWRHLHRQAPSRVASSQIRLFGDKLTSNLLVGGSLTISVGLSGCPWIHFVDPAAGLAMVLATAWWSAPAITQAVRDLADVLVHGRVAASATLRVAVAPEQPSRAA